MDVVVVVVAEEVKENALEKPKAGEKEVAEAVSSRDLYLGSS